MIRRPWPLLLLALPLLGASECSDPGVAPTSPRELRVDLHARGADAATRLDQEDVAETWVGEHPLLFVPMVPPVQVTGSVSDGGDVEPDACIFLDGPGTLGDSSSASSTLGTFGQTALPGLYDLILAPGCFVAGLPAAVTREVSVEPDGSSTAALELEVPERAPVALRVVGPDGDLPGVVVTLYPAGDADLPLGVSGVSGPGGALSIELPDGAYDLTFSTPANGVLGVAPLRIRNRTLPLEPGFTLTAELPDLATTTVEGVLIDGTGTRRAGRIRLEGFVQSDNPLAPYPGGFYRAEFATEDGEWLRDLPPGDYTATAYPPHPGVNAEVTDDTARVAFTMDPLVGPPEVIELRYATRRAGQVRVLDPAGLPVAGRVNLRMTSAPHYVFQYRLNDQGSITAALMADLYEVEFLPDPEEETGRDLWPRAHGLLDLTGGNELVDMRVVDGEVVEGFVYTEGEARVPRVKLLLRDPETGEVFDDVLSASSPAGFFRGILPAL